MSMRKEFQGDVKSARTGLELDLNWTTLTLSSLSDNTPTAL